MRFLQLCALGSGLLLIVSCGENRFTEPQTFAGQTVSAETLTHGYEQYMLNCVVLVMELDRQLPLLMLVIQILDI